MNELVKPIGYEIYLQDFSKPYVCLELLGYCRSQSEAINCVKLFREALSKEENGANKTVLFRPIIKR